jgi:hypothetical protein
MRGRGSFTLNRRSRERWTKCPQLLEETPAANVNPLKPVELVEVDINSIVPEQPKMSLHAPMVKEELVATMYNTHCDDTTTDGEPLILVLALRTWLRSINYDSLQQLPFALEQLATVPEQPIVASTAPP